MKRFLLHTSSFLIVVAVSFFVITCFADGTADPYYLKFTTSKQNSLIIGSSRAAQGMQPQIMNEVLENVELFNYAFTILHSPFGESYFNSIRKKINVNSEKGLFIVCVNPWAISSTTINPEDYSNYREIGSFVEKTNFVNLNPNIEYIFESYENKNIQILTNKNKIGKYETTRVHDNGWLEVIVKNDEAMRDDRTKRKINSYREKLKQYSGFSEVRYSYLKKTIELLKENGTVYLLRIPVYDEMLMIENELMPDFNDKMMLLSKAYKVNYIDATIHNAEYRYSDGQHLDVESGKKFSKFIANTIKQTIR